MYLLDSNICIDFMHGRLPFAYDLMRKSSPGVFKIPAVVEAELRLGAYKSNNPKKVEWVVEKFLLPFEVVPFDSRCAQAYARIRSELERTGTPIGPNDLLIAATAAANQATLVTNNVSEFKRVSGISIESWHEAPWSDDLSA